MTYPFHFMHLTFFLLTLVQIFIGVYFSPHQGNTVCKYKLQVENQSRNRNKDIYIFTCFWCRIKISYQQFVLFFLNFIKEVVGRNFYLQPPWFYEHFQTQQFADVLQNKCSKKLSNILN